MIHTARARRFMASLSVADRVTCKTATHTTSPGYLYSACYVSQQQLGTGCSATRKARDGCGVMPRTLSVAGHSLA